MPDYRYQAAASITGLTSCSTCDPTSVQYAMCYSSVDADGLCCGTPTPVVVWIPFASTPANATLYYSNAALTTRSPSGFYSDNLPTSCEPVNSNIRITECFSGLSYNTINTNNFALGDVVSFTPNSGGNARCGTVIDIAWPVGFADATISSPANWGDCTDSVHCPQP
jgi:hypothetical protein